jgi:serine/threonine protein kinase
MSVPPWQSQSVTKSPNVMSQAAFALKELVAQRKEIACTERVLASFPELSSNRDSVLELLYLEHLYRHEDGDSRSSEVALQEYTERYPDLRDELVKLFHVSDAIVGPDFGSSIQDFDTTYTGGQGSRATDAQEPIVGVLRDYDLLEEVGRGGMGIVYRALQRGLSRIVAVKTLSSLDQLDQNAMSRFQKEAELASSLQHPNIVPIHEVGLSGGVPYFSMEYVEGGSLEQAIRNRPLRPDLAAQLVGIVARAIDFAHSKGVVHRDLKPGNILLAPSKRPEALLLSIKGSKPRFYRTQAILPVVHNRLCVSSQKSSTLDWLWIALYNQQPTVPKWSVPPATWRLSKSIPHMAQSDLPAIFIRWAPFFTSCS